MLPLARLSFAALLLLAASPARAQWEPVPLPPEVGGAQVALFGFAAAFGPYLYLYPGFSTLVAGPTPGTLDYVSVYTSPDGGQTWAADPAFRVPATSSALILARPFVDGGALYVPRYYEDGGPTPPVIRSAVARTTDGATWSFPTPTGLTPALPLRSMTRQGGTLYASAGESSQSTTGAVYRSDDDGAAWTRVGGDQPTGLMFSAGSVLLLGKGPLSTAPGERSDDEGVTWTPFGVGPLTPNGARINDVARSSDGVTLVGIFRSTDGGVTFAPAPTPVASVTACGPTFVALAGSRIARSDDGGLTWADWAEGLPDAGFSTRGLSCSAGGPGGGPTYVYATVPSGGFVYRRDLAQMPVAAAEAPASGGLGATVGPNPAVTTATLRLTLGAPATVRVTVADALGRTVLTVERALGAGAQALPLDVARLAPGVYVARILSSGASASVRFTVAR